MPLDLDCTDPMYLLGRVVATVESSYLTSPVRRVADDAGLLDTLLVRPSAGLALLAKRYVKRWQEADVQEIVAILPPGGLPEGPVKIEAQGPFWMGYYHQCGANEADWRIVGKFDPETLRRVGEALFGLDHWQSEMTRALGLSDSARVRAWISDNPNKSRRVPAGVCRDLMAMLRQRSAEAKALADEIDQQASE